MFLKLKRSTVPILRSSLADLLASRALISSKYAFAF